MKWETVCTETLQRVRRCPVPGGWLYQVEFMHWKEDPDDVIKNYFYGWHPPTFVPEPVSTAVQAKPW